MISSLINFHNFTKELIILLFLYTTLLFKFIHFHLILFSLVANHASYIYKHGTYKRKCERQVTLQEMKNSL